MVEYTIIIPARFASTRLPGKPLVDIAGRPMIEHVWRQALKTNAHRVIIATDHKKVAETASAFGAEVCMTSEEHESGTSRLAEVIEKMAIADDEIVVNIQGDEPLIQPEIVEQLANNIANSGVGMATLGVRLTSLEELFNPNAVKAVCDKNGFALYFSRAAIPWHRDEFNSINTTAPKADINLAELPYLRHIGLYAYRAEFIKQYVNWSVSPLEKIESLEQLRVLWHGEKIHLDFAVMTPEVGVDTAEDLEKVREIFSRK